ncbi:MAG: dienelactone hydrolase family protein [PS1 clade bacterium]|uniref:Dienelactone hydrolase family protein n=1 Tax=PS1 clade bacterium TaxID=2175152 RepID=A0A937HIB7_9PROT|nr:dienelactone hydrolase family protein [PS1 clade bacterium]
MSEMVKVEVAGGGDYFDAYLATPSGTPKGGVVVIQEIFGVNADIKETANWLAGEGYLALAPDLFWRQERNVALTDGSEEEWQKAFALMNGYDGDEGVGDLQAAIDYLRAAGCAKVGTIGFCLGGRMVYLAACRTNGDAHASYYGVGIEGLLGEAGNITAPTLIHIAAEDAFVPKDAQTAIADGLAAHMQAEVHIYDGQDHAFARHNGMHYDADATALAHGRTLALFAEALA